MSSGVLFLCNGAQPPAEWRGRWDRTERLNTEGAAASVNFSIGDFDRALGGALDGRSLDLVRIAAFALAADQSISRGGDADPKLSAWHRDMGLVMPVNDPAFWLRADVTAALRECLGFVSDDDWDFRFVPASAETDRQILLGDKAGAPDGEADVVIPFSGGLDSLTAVVEALRAGRRPLLISHASSNVPKSARQRLFAAMKALFPGRTIGRISAHANRRGPEAVERTRRSRSFFFASASMVCAVKLDVRDVLLADNGWVSVNPRINGQLIGARATRSTHPRFLNLFNELAALVFETPPLLRNPFWDQTRSQVVQRLVAAGGTDLVEDSRSCAHGRNLRRETPHCGRCSQCIDRRFATEFIGLTDGDRPDAYAFDIFTEPLGDSSRALALSYVRTARTIERRSDDALLVEYPELIECLRPGHEDDDAQAYVSMLRAQAGVVLRVVADHLAAAAPEMARGEIARDSLLGLLAADQASFEGGALPLVTAPDYLTATWRETDFSFNKDQAVVVRALLNAHREGLGGLTAQSALRGTRHEGGRMSDLFKHHRAWNTLIVRDGRLYRLDLSPHVS